MLSKQTNDAVGDAIKAARKAGGDGYTLAAAARQAFLHHAPREAADTLKKLCDEGLEVSVYRCGDGYAAEISDRKRPSKAPAIGDGETPAEAILEAHDEYRYQHA